MAILESTSLSRKLQALATICLMIASTLVVYASDVGPQVQNEQATRLQSIKQRAQNNKLTIGDMHESGAHLRIVAARLRDSGSERNVDGYIKNTANTNTLLNKCLNSGRKGVTKADCQTALTMVRSNGTHTMLQAAASVAYNGDQWGNFIPTRYVGGARLMPVVLPNCQGAREAVDIVMIVAAAEAFFPAAQPAAGITALFGAILMLALDKYC